MGPSDGSPWRLLDLFCGEGGAALGYHRAGFDVFGVDLNDRGTGTRHRPRPAPLKRYPVRGELLSRLQGYDGWALSTSSEALPELLAVCVARGLDDVRVGAWFRGAQMRARSYSPLRAWEPVLYRRARPRDESVAPVLDSLVYVARPRLTDPERVIGAKPAAFVWWIFDLVAALPGDSFDDLYPGSGGFGRAWELYNEASRVAGVTEAVAGISHDGSRRDLEPVVPGSYDGSSGLGDGRDTSPLEHEPSPLDRAAAA